MRKAGDEGRPFILRGPGREEDSPTWQAVDRVMENLIASIEMEEKEQV